MQEEGTSCRNARATTSGFNPGDSRPRLLVLLATVVKRRRGMQNSWLTRGRSSSHCRLSRGLPRGQLIGRSGRSNDRASFAYGTQNNRGCELFGPGPVRRQGTTAKPFSPSRLRTPSFLFMVNTSAGIMFGDGPVDHDWLGVILVQLLTENCRDL